MTVESPPKKPKMLGERLLESGLISAIQLSLALSEQRRQGGMLGETLERLGFATQEQISRILASEARTTFVDLDSMIVDSEVLRLVPPDFARAHTALPISREGDVLTVAIADTFDVHAIDTLERTTSLRVDVVAAPPQAIQDAIEQKYSQAVSMDQLVESALTSGVLEMGEDAGKIAPLIRLVDQIIAKAVRLGATDVHIGPEEALVRVRYRIDGILHQEAILPKALQAAVEARCKIMAGLDVTERRLPQDGRISFHLGRRKVDLRVSTLPTQFGESVVMRILDKQSGVLSLDGLGMAERDCQIMLQAIAKPHGIILVTGPTGSGKTTTLYAALSTMDSLHRSIYTLEDPIEYRLPLIRQTQVNADIGMTFASGLRSLLRQDPDIILVGEIRDEETAQLATRAALTGHLVLSTLHTNSASGAIPRLINMGVEPYLLASALIAVQAQRLVRKVCKHCSVPDPDSKNFASRYGVSVAPEDTFLKGKGCPKCMNTGYAGRIAVCEVLRMDEPLVNACRSGVTEREVAHLAKRSGMSSIMEDGLNKARAGLVNLEDLLRVVG